MAEAGGSQSDIQLNPVWAQWGWVPTLAPDSNLGNIHSQLFPILHHNQSTLKHTGRPAGLGASVDLAAAAAYVDLLLVPREAYI